ncbi:glycosyltransferase family 4 protein [Vreelandella zhaodongensis]|uniref:glycosyltransferase family 4 protein n=1 Tax=Vreelandella zhaodongensis TaxID=1176240 RepID=UPI003EBD8AC8
MKVLVTANHTPFIAGGANYHVEGLVKALRQYGHQVECLRLPFHYGEAQIERQMNFAEQLDLGAPNDVSIDRVISLQFPTYGVQHPEHVVWLMHQHRVCYELYDPAQASPALVALKPHVEAYDKRHLGQAKRLFANSPRVAERLKHYCGLSARPLYHPPHQAEQFVCGDDWGYVFYPSRLEPLKRQSLLIEAMALTQTPVMLLLTGKGSQQRSLEQQVERLGLGNRVRFLGHTSEQEKRTLYAHALAVAFPTFDEDYGYVTLEAMLASKPVITCTDSGGPTAFVEHGVTGWQCPPTPQAIAAALDEAYVDRSKAKRMGEQGREAYQEANISWHQVVTKLVYEESI